MDSKLKHVTLTMFLCGLLAGALAPVAALAQPQTETIAKQAILVDPRTNAILLAKSADAQMHPASMSKMMTVYMVFERLRDGRLKLDDKFSVSENAWRKGGAASGSSTMFLEPKDRVTVKQLLQGIIVQSGNDACITIAEGLAGSESAFAEEMTQRARELGLKDSHFANATGWPNPGQMMTAHDLARLAELIIKNFPQYYHYFSEKNFTYNGIRQGNRNPLLYRDIGADGLKTGHTSQSGYGIVASAKRNGRRLILVVNGLPSVKARATESERLLDWGFREFNDYDLLKAGEKVSDATVWLGADATVPLIIQKDLVVTLPREARRKMKVTVNYQGPIPAPIKKGTVIAKLVVSAPGVPDVDVPLVAGQDVERLGLFGRLGAALKHILWGATG